METQDNFSDSITNTKNFKENCDAQNLIRDILPHKSFPLSYEFLNTC